VFIAKRWKWPLKIKFGGEKEEIVAKVANRSLKMKFHFIQYVIRVASEELISNEKQL
jgi:hypothetical protein